MRISEYLLRRLNDFGRKEGFDVYYDEDIMYNGGRLLIKSPNWTKELVIYLNREDLREDMADHVMYYVQKKVDEHRAALGYENAKRILNDTYGLNRRFRIKKVIFNDPATIVYWDDGSKTVVKKQDGDVFDPEKGLAMAIAKRAIGNNKSQSNFNDIIHKYTDQFWKERELEDRFRYLREDIRALERKVANIEKELHPNDVAYLNATNDEANVNIKCGF